MAHGRKGPRLLLRARCGVDRLDRVSDLIYKYGDVLIASLPPSLPPCHVKVLWIFTVCILMTLGASLGFAFIPVLRSAINQAMPPLLLSVTFVVGTAYLT